MKPGDVVNPKARNTLSGLPVAWGPCVLVSKIGTVPNYWEVRRLDDGKMLKVFVHPEDETQYVWDGKQMVLKENGEKAKFPLKTGKVGIKLIGLKVIKGGKDV